MKSVCEEEFYCLIRAKKHVLQCPFLPLQICIPWPHVQKSLEEMPALEGSWLKFPEINILQIRPIYI